MVDDIDFEIFKTVLREDKVYNVIIDRIIYCINNKNIEIN